jgi:uncharacterized protein with ParB-like and HNH nuclease domain
MLKQPERTDLSLFIQSVRKGQIVIPVFQRSYSWTFGRETGRFLGDLERLLEKPEERHFLGIIMTGVRGKNLSIIDGQQRITTAFIYLLALRKLALFKGEDKTADLIDKNYLQTRTFGHEPLFRLKSSDLINDVFARLLYGSDLDLKEEEKDTAFYENYEGIRNFLERMNKQYTCRQMLDVFSRIDLLVFPLSDGDDIQEIYESINSTGAPLTSADLIRNFLLMNEPEEIQERWYRMYWKPLEEDYPESRELEEFFRYYLAVKTFGLLNRADIYEGFKKYWTSHVKSYEAGLQEVDRFCRYYHAVYDGTFTDPQIEEVFRDYRTNGSHYPAPLFLESLNLYEEKKITKEELCASVRMIDTYMTRRMLCGNDTVVLSRWFPTLLRTVLRDFEEGTDYVTALRKNLIEINRGHALAMPTDKQVMRAMQEVNAYSLMNIRAVLERIEQYASPARVDTSQLNIEHIMPRSPSAWWLAHAGVKDEDDYDTTVNLIGNLTLCAESDNRRMGNEDFASKKQILARTGHIRLNTAILKEKNWGRAKILKRSEQMAREIIRIWPYGKLKHTKKGNSLKPKRGVNMKEQMITLNAPTVSAHAMEHDNGTIEILAGTTMKPYGQKEMKKMRTLYKELDEKGILSDTSNGRVQFNQSYTFASRNEAAQFLMHRGGDNASAWISEEEASAEGKPEEKKTASKKADKPKKHKEKTKKEKPEKKTSEKKTAEKSKKSENKKTKKSEKKTAKKENRSSEEPKPKQTKKSSAKAHSSKETSAKKSSVKKTGKSSSRSRRNARNPRGIKPQGTAALEAATRVVNPSVVMFAGMGQQPLTPQPAERKPTRAGRRSSHASRKPSNVSAKKTTRTKKDTAKKPVHRTARKRTKKSTQSA